MFGRKDKEEVFKKPIEIHSIEQLPGVNFRSLGLVKVEASRFGGGGFTSLIETLQDRARELDADAIIGFRTLATSGSGAGAFSLLMAYGTAIRFIDEKGDSE